MPPKSLRRSRALDSEDDEPVRSGTPVSTAPNDGKRARRTLNQDRDTSSPDTVDRASDNEEQPPPERKPVITNGFLTNKPKHQPGAIVRIKLTNFVTYTSAEFFPGPNLNMVIGPNGTGKSTLLVAMATLAANLSKQCVKPSRILITAHTNVAVDRVLLGLQESGFKGAPFSKVAPLGQESQHLLFISCI